jgi:monoamine oxidase
MSGDQPRFLVVGAGAAGLMAARELARAGNAVALLEARSRCGGRIHPLPAAEFGYAAEGGAEFVHGAAPVTSALLSEAGLSLSPVSGARWSAREGALTQNMPALPHEDELQEALAELDTDLPIAAFLERHFADPRYGEMRRSLLRMIEGYDAADPNRASTFALREEWMGHGMGRQARIAEGYGALIAFLEAECRRYGVATRLAAKVVAIEASGEGIVARCEDGSRSDVAGGAVVTVPPPVLADIALPAGARERAAAYAEIGYGNVVEILLRFDRAWWADVGGRNFADLSFLFANTAVPTWWTQEPRKVPVLTGWLAGPRTAGMEARAERELVRLGLESLAEIFALDVNRIAGQLVAATAVNWAKDPFARGAYSYATPRTREAQSALKRPDDGLVFFSGEALYGGRDMGTVEAALASGRETAETIIAAGRP